MALTWVSLLTPIELVSTEHLEGLCMGDVDGLSRDRTLSAELVGKEHLCLHLFNLPQIDTLFKALDPTTGSPQAVHPFMVFQKLYTLVATVLKTV